MSLSQLPPLLICELCPKYSECKCKTVEIGFHAKTRKDDPRLRIKINSKKSLNPKNLMDRRLYKKASIYSFKSKTPVIPKLCRMSIQKLREKRNLKLLNQYQNQQNASKMQDCTHFAESQQQEFENRKREEIKTLLRQSNHNINSFSK